MAQALSPTNRLVVIELNGVDKLSRCRSFDGAGKRHGSMDGRVHTEVFTKLGRVAEGFTAIQELLLDSRLHTFRADAQSKTRLCAASLRDRRIPFHLSQAGAGD